MTKPLLAITMGDPAGVGPEAIVGAWPNPNVHAACRPFAVGHSEIFRRAAKVLGNKIEVIEISSPDEATPSPTQLFCLHTSDDRILDLPPALPDARGGQAAFDALTSAAKLAIGKQIDGLVTAPLHKGALWMAGHQYPGHTELLAELCGVSHYAMMLYLATVRRNSIGKRLGNCACHVAYGTAKCVRRNDHGRDSYKNSPHRRLSEQTQNCSHQELAYAL